MLSRVADHVYWMNRFIERAENYARFMDVNFNLSLELHPYESSQWKPLVVASGDWPLYESLNDTVNKEKVIYFLGFDENNNNSIYSCIIAARENARAIRPELTKEVWEQINFLYYYVKEAKENKVWDAEDPRNYFVDIKKGCQLLYGIIDSTISKTEAWNFGRMGQLVERADKTSRVLDVKYHMLLPENANIGSPFDLIQWTALLKSVSAYDMYRKKYGKLTASGITEFLIFDKSFPRSIFSCLIGVDRCLKSITKSNENRNEVEKQLGLLRSHLEYTDIQDVFKFGVHEYLDDILKKLNKVTGSLYDTYFSVENIIKDHEKLTHKIIA